MTDQPNIIELEEKLNALKAQKKSKKSKSTKALDKEMSLIKKDIRKLYAELKANALAFEKTNFGRLYFVKSTDNFEKLFENSALIYHDSVAPKLNLSSRVLKDGDYANRAENGYCSIRHADTLRRRLFEIGATVDKAQSKPGLTVVKLPWGYREKDLERLKKNNAMFVGLFEKTVLAHNIYPTFFIQVNELIQIVYENTRSAHDPLFKEVIGRSLLSYAINMKITYLNFCNKLLPVQQAIDDIEQNLSYFRSYSKVVADLNIWQPCVLARIADRIDKIESILKHIKNDLTAETSAKEEK